MVTQPVVRTVNKSWFTSSASEVIQYNLTSAIKNRAPNQNSSTYKWKNIRFDMLVIIKKDTRGAEFLEIR